MKNFISKMEKLNIEITDEMAEKFENYYKLLVEKNKVMNLTAITEYDEVLLKHFYDSLSIVRTMDIKNVEKVIDVGTGGGFPGIPLKIVFPHLKITLLDSLNKRIVWLNEVIEELDLKDIKAYHGRAEEFGHKDDYREQYDLCVSRAVANLSTLSEYCIPFVKKNGYFVSYKAATVNEEVETAKKSVKILGGEIKDICSFLLDDVDMERNLVKIQKVSKTPNKYPRKAGLPTKEPLV